VVLEQLKLETAAAHASIEQRLRIARSRPSLDDYRTYLVAMHGFTAPVEQRLRQLAASFESELELERRYKAELLAEDLAALEERLAAPTEPRPWCDALPENRDVAQAFGTLYVLEGSTLGARFLLRHLQPLGIDDCSRYLRSYGASLGAMWEKLRRALLGHAARHPDQVPALIAAAQDTFRTLDAWCVRCVAAEASSGT
jgi:heme oxygenase (biliverdin-IX-beta and delta-forming)